MGGFLILYLTMCGYECRCTCSIAKTWENVNTDHADVKEVRVGVVTGVWFHVCVCVCVCVQLIPEFYLPPGDFLKNIMVGVVLWYKGSVIL